jgi:hypothetical protein
LRLSSRIGSNLALPSVVLLPDGRRPLRGSRRRSPWQGHWKRGKWCLSPGRRRPCRNALARTNRARRSCGRSASSSRSSHGVHRKSKKRRVGSRPPSPSRNAAARSSPVCCISGSHGTACSAILLALLLVVDLQFFEFARRPGHGAGFTRSLGWRHALGPSFRSVGGHFGRILGRNKQKETE